MLRHYFLMAQRGLSRQKLYSFINVIGLSVALTCAILILLFVRGQLSWDDWIPDTAHLYRLELTFHPLGVAQIRLAMCPFPVLTAVGKQIAGVDAITHVVPETMTVTASGRQFLETVTVVDPNFFQVIRLPLVRGDAAQVLAQPESVVLSQSEAHKYFGDEDPVGRVLKVSGVFPGACKANDSACFSAVHTLTVTGVLRDLPHNTQLIANLVMPNTSQADELPQLNKSGSVAWTTTGGDYGYVELDPGVSPAAVLAALKPILDRSVPFHRTGSGDKHTPSELEQYHLTPFRDVHLTSDSYSVGMRPGGSRTMIYGFVAVALLIVLVACCNFMNLTTALATQRAREIALRKIAGAKRRQLIVQFLGEAVLTVLVSLAIALAAVEVLLPLYDRFLGQPVGIHSLSEWKPIVLIGAGAIAVGLLSGVYPALVLSAFRPAWALKAQGSDRSGSSRLRSALVVGQFAVSIGLGVAAIAVFRQISFARSLNLGFKPGGLVVVQGTINLPSSERVRLEHLWRSGPGIAGTTLSSIVPFNTGESTYLYTAPEGERPRTVAEFIYMSPSFPSLYGLRLLAGRLLSSAPGVDTASTAGVQNVLINAQAAYRFLQSPASAVGKFLVQGATRLRVVGVVGDAITDGLTRPVQPAIFVPDPAKASLLSIRVRSGRMPEALAFLDRTWRSMAPNVAMDRYFLDASFNQLLTSDQRAGTMFGVFVGVAVIIACLGLFGLAVFTAQQRMLEIGIRKISGARTPDIVRLMLWRISAPVVAANVIAWPIAFFYLHRWLEGYAYRITVDPAYFLGAGAAALLIAWATVFANTWRLARRSPTHALHYE